MKSERINAIHNSLFSLYILDIEIQLIIMQKKNSYKSTTYCFIFSDQYMRIIYVSTH